MRDTAATLLRHLEKYYTDLNIAKDLDAVLNACRSEPSRKLVKRYAKARRSAPGFAPGKVKSNADRIPVGERKAMTRQANKIHAKEVEAGAKKCLVCRERWTPKRSDALVCSEACRKRGRRAKTAVLNSQCMHKNKLSNCTESWCRSRIEDMSDQAFIRPPESVQDKALV